MTTSIFPAAALGTFRFRAAPFRVRMYGAFPSCARMLRTLPFRAALLYAVPLWAVPLWATLTIAAAAHAAASSPAYSEDILQAAGVISKSQAIAIAQQAVGGATPISAVYEKSDGIPHWSVDLVGARYEYEVWVSAAGRVLRIITQPK